MITNIATPVGVAVTGFLAAGLNTLVTLGVWHATAEQISSVNGLILAGVGLVAAFRAGAQHAGTLTPTPNGNGHGTG